MKRVGFYPWLIAVLVSACGIYKDKQPTQDLTRLQNTATYRTVNENVFQKNRCLQCHSSSGMSAGGVALDNYAIVKANLGRIERAALINKTMPPSGPLSATDQAILRAWIDRGAPELDPQTTPTPVLSPTPTPTPILLEPKFSSIKVNILDKKCIACHSTGGTADKIPLTSYAEILNSPREIVIPKQPDDSGMVIYTEAPDTEQKRMPPVNSGLPRLTIDETKTIRQWILNGAKDD